MKDEIKHFFTVLNLLKKNKHQAKYIALIKDKDYNQVMSEVRVNEWLKERSYP